MHLSKEFGKGVQPLLDVHLWAAENAIGASSGPAKSLPPPMPKAQLSRTAKDSLSTQVKSPTPLQTKQASPALMDSDWSGATYETPAGSMSDGVEPLDT